MSLDWTQIAIAIIGAIMTLIAGVVGLFFRIAKNSIESHIKSTRETIEQTVENTKDAFDRHVKEITDQLHAIVDRLERMNESFNNSKIDQALLSERVASLERLVMARPCVRKLMGQEVKEDYCPNHFKP